MNILQELNREYTGITVHRYCWSDTLCGPVQVVVQDFSHTPPFFSEHTLPLHRCQRTGDRAVRQGTWAVVAEVGRWRKNDLRDTLGASPVFMPVHKWPNSVESVCVCVCVCVCDSFLSLFFLFTYQPSGPEDKHPVKITTSPVLVKSFCCMQICLYKQLAVFTNDS